MPTFGGKYVNLTDKLRHVNSSKSRSNKKKLFELQQEFYNAEGEQKLELLIQIKFLILEIVKLQMDYEYNKEVEDSARTMDLFNPQPLAEVKVDESKRSVVTTCIKYQRELLSTSKSLEEKATISIPFFDWKIMFSDIFSGDNNGFDIVIGNPPYIKEGRISKDFFKQYKNSPYYKGKMDIWYMFACYGIDLLNSNGLICFIATNNWGTSFGASKLRDKVVTETRICNLVDFGAAMMFENASIQTMIMMFQKDRETDNYKFDYRKLTSNTATEREAISILDKTLKDAEYFYPTVKRDDLNNKTITFSQNEGILDKIYNNNSSLIFPGPKRPWQ